MGKLKLHGATFLMTLLLILSLCLPVFATGESSEWDIHDTSISVGVFDDVCGKYALKNRTLTGPGPLFITDSIELLLQSGGITDFTEREGRLYDLTYLEEDAAVTLQESADFRFYVKRNGEPVPEDQLDQYLADGDIVEWVYTTAERYDRIQAQALEASQPNTENTQPAEDWSEETASIQEAACNWLDRHATTHTEYLLAIGCAGRSADVEAVNQLQAEVRQDASDDPAYLSHLILQLSFCGFDASYADLSELLSRVAESEDLAEQPDAVSGTLLAYDSRNYAIPNSAPNSREALIDALLELQTSSGGFRPDPGTSARVSSTVQAILALSSYTDQVAVSAAIDRAVTFLAESQIRLGISGSDAGTSDSRSLSQIILALSAAGVPLSDERFRLDDVDLLTRLMSYRREDGSFAQFATDESGDAASTAEAVIALASIRKNGNPFRLSSSSSTTIPISTQTPLQEISDEQQTYLIIGASLLLLIVLLALVAVLLKKMPPRQK